MHRSLSFWSGLLLIIFTCWAWRDSLAFDSSAARGDYKISHRAGGLEICLDSFGDPFGPYPASDSVARVPIAQSMLPDTAVRAFQAPFFLRGRNAEDKYVTFTILGEPVSYRDRIFDAMAWHPRGDWALFLPHWLILLALLIPWIALLAWRARRMKRGLAAIPPSP
jgi:hypothetical protein